MGAAAPMRISIYCGDITKAPADVVCTSTNPHLKLILGTGGAIRHAGGWSIQEECAAHIAQERQKSGRTWLEPGSAVVTTSGALSFLGVIHCVAIDAFHDSSVQIVRECVRNILRLVQEKWGTSEIRVAMPVLATGHGHLGFETSIRAMIEELKSAEPDGPTEVLFVVYEESRLATAGTFLEEQFATGVEVRG